ncbi:choice-of-anchor J domain-containing protein [Chryseolinea sp. H1M3-3]|uniref:choice-of-anchor J domain-containing protein n=1 Tax=Chryseolinea sp. H1M3-3 TaxID=3034144 RepID=UPI0023EE23C3|nr:choice-of-anchor J domain-containing protein [Chryseolinea sp. H1M3-3]
MKKSFFVLLLVTTLKLQAQTIDLSTENFTVSSSDEKHLQYSFTLKNAGTSSTQGYGLKIFFSNDEVMGEDDQLFVVIPFENVPAQAIGPNASVPKNGEYTAASPGGYLPAGTWHVFLEVNYSREVTETNYANNFTQGNQITINPYDINFTSPPEITSITDRSFVINTFSEADLTRIYYVIQMDGSPAPDVSTLKKGKFIYPWSSETPVTDLGPSTDYDVYFMGEFYDGKVTSILKIDVETAGLELPTLIATPGEINFVAVNKDEESKSLQFLLKAFHLTADVKINAFGNFLVSKDNNTYSNEITFPAASFSSGLVQTVYVKFLPGGEAGFHEGEIIHTSANAANLEVKLSGIAYNPAAGSFDGLSNLEETGWQEISIEGYHTWELIDRDNTAAGRTASDNKVLRMDGSLNNNTENEDWLITPKNNLSSFAYIPMISFESYTMGVGFPLALKYSTNYIGQGSPADATWINIDGHFPSGDTRQWTLSSGIEIPKDPNIYFAFVYTSSEAQASRWLIDNWKISDALIDIPVFDFKFEDVVVGTASEAEEIEVHVSGFGNITVSVSDKFQVSLNNSDFSSNVMLTEAQAAAGQPLFVRFVPDQPVEYVSGSLTFSGNGLNVSRGNLVGSTSITTGIFNPVEISQVIYPSPTEGTVYVNSDALPETKSEIYVQVINGIGGAVGQFKSRISDVEATLTQVMQQVQPGIYFIILQSGNLLVRDKIVKE